MSDRNRIRRLVLPFLASCTLAITPAAAADFTLKLAHAANQTTVFNKAMELFAKTVGERSGGRIEVKVFHSSQLGGERDYVEGLQLGSVEIAAVTTSALTSFEPQVAIFNLPFLFKSSEHFDKVVDGPVGTALAKKLEARQIRVLGFTDMGVRYMHDTIRPITKPADLVDLKMRVPQDSVPLATYAALGARAIPMAWPEVYSALKQGVIDGLDNALPFYEASGTYESAKYLTVGVPIFQATGILAVSGSTYARLPADLRKVLDESATAVLPEQRRMFREDAKVILERLRGKGVVITETDPAPFAAAAETVWDKFAAQVGGKAAIQAVVNTGK